MLSQKRKITPQRLKIDFKQTIPAYSLNEPLITSHIRIRKKKQIFTLH